MALVLPNETDYAQDNIVMILSGLPGIGKTTCACSAPGVIVIDVDNGMKRVRPEHRKPSIVVNTYDELLNDLRNPVVRNAKTLVIDTGGALIELMKEWAADQPGGQKKGGGLSLQGFGIVKSEFNRLFREVRKYHNCVLLFHTLKERDRDGSAVYDIQCEGATKQTVWQPVDLGCYMQFIGNDRYLCFKPTQEYSAKKCYGVSDMYKVPELSDGEPNNLLENLFAEVKANLAAEAESGKIKKAEYESVMQQGRDIINSVSNVKTATAASKQINELPESLTSRDELRCAFKMKLDELGIRWNKEAGKYEPVSDDSKSA